MFCYKPVTPHNNEDNLYKVNKIMPKTDDSGTTKNFKKTIDFKGIFLLKLSKKVNIKDLA